MSAAIQEDRLVEIDRIDTGWGLTCVLYGHQHRPPEPSAPVAWDSSPEPELDPEIAARIRDQIESSPPSPPSRTTAQAAEQHYDDMPPPPPWDPPF